jgi:hypothetical protein
MLVLPTLLAAVLFAGATQEVSPLPSRVDELIRRLGSDGADVRSKAMEDLKSLGKAVLPALKSAFAETKDAEVKARLGQLVRKLEPAALQALEDYLAEAKIDVQAIDILKDEVVEKTLPEVIFAQLWKRGQAAAWKVLGFDSARKDLFDTSEAKAWAVYAQDPRRDPIAIETAHHRVTLAGFAPHASIAAYSGAPTLSLFLKLENRAVNLWVKADGHTVEARSPEAKPLWEVDVGQVSGGNVGAPVVRFMSAADDRVSLVVGKHSHVTLDLKTGKVLGSGSD